MVLRIPLEITSSGNGKTVAELLEIQKAIERTAKEAPGISQLAASLGSTYKEAKQLATGLNLTAEGASQAVGLLKQLNSVNADTATKFKVLLGTLGTTAEQFEVLDRSVSSIGKSGTKLGSVFQGIGQGIGQAGFGLITQSLGSVQSKVVSTTLQFEKFRTVLKTLYGTTELADAAFNQIQEFAAKTPFQLDEVLQSFISLKNRGINPTNETLTSLGDIASSQGKSLGQITEAVLDASQKEGERLKEFGINASFAGDKATLAFKGVNKEVDATPEAITAAVLEFGKLQGVAGGMEAQSKTLGGQLSNLQDTASKAANAFGEELIPILSELVGGLNTGGEGAVEFAKKLGEDAAVLVQFLSNALKFASENSKLFEIALQALVVQLVAVKAIALVSALQGTSVALIASGVASGNFSAAIAVARTAMLGFQASLLAALPLIIAVGGAVAAIQTFQFVDGLVKANESLDALQTSTNIQGGATQNLANNTKQLTAALEEQLKKTGQLSAAQKKQAADQLKLNAQQLKDLKAQLGAAEKQPESKGGLFGIGKDEADAQNNARKVLIADTKIQIASLENQNAALTKATGVTGKDTEATKKATVAKKSYQDRIDAISDATEKRTSQAGIAETDALTEVAEAELKGAADKEQAEERKLQAAQTRINAELDAERDRLEKLKALPVSKDEKETKVREEAIQKSEEKISQLQLNSSQNRLAQREADEKAALDKITETNQKAQNAIAATYQQRELQIQTQLNNGVIDEQQAQEQRLKATADRIAKELALEKQLQSQVAKDPNISQDEKEKRQVDSAKKIADLQLAAAQNREAVEKATVARIVAANEKAQSAIANATKQREIEIQTQLNKGVIDDAEAQRLKLNATADRIAQELALEQKLQAQIANDPTISKGKKEKQQAASLKKIADLQLASVQNREAIEKAALDRIVAANQEAEAKIAASQAVRTTQIKQAVLDRKLSEEDATKQLEQIALESSNQIVAAKKQELAQIQAARANGSITIAQAAETEKQLQVEIGQATLQRIEAEIQARRKSSELAIDASLGEQQRSLQALNQSRSGELGLLQAQSGLQESLNNLANERLNTQIAIAEASGNSAQADQLRLQALSLQESQQAALEESQNRELALKQEIRLADAQIAETEAEIAIARAESAGASERELANLQRILDLRKKQVGQAAELNTVDGKVLKANQATSREKSKQAQIQARSQKGNSQPTTTKTGSTEAGGQDGGNISSDGSRTTRTNKDGSTATLNKAVTQKAVTISTAGLQAATDESGDAIKATAKSFDTTATSANNLANAFDGAAAKVGTGQQVNTADAFDANFRAQNPGVQGLTSARIKELEDQIGKLANNPNEDFATGRAKVEAFSRDLAKQGIDPRSLSVNLGEGQFKADILAALEAFRSQPVKQPVQFTTVQGAEATPANSLDLLAASATNLKTVFEQLAIASANAKLTPVRGLFTGGGVGAGETFIGNEQGAELIKMGGKTALLGDGTPGLFQADRPGYVFNAQQTAAILAGVKPGAIATTKLATATAQTNGGNDRAVVAQLQALRQDVSNLQPDGGEYHFHREDKEALALTFKLQQGLQRARYRS